MKRKWSVPVSRLPWVCAVTSLLLGGCIERDVPTAPDRAKVPDLRETVDEMEVSLFDSNNPYTAEVLSSLNGRSEVKREMNRFAPQGYRYDRETSFVNEGVLADGRHVQVSIINLKNEAAPDRDAVSLFCLSGPRHLTVVPVRLYFNAGAADPGATRIGEGVWMSVVEPIDALAGPEKAAFRWSWRRWFGCVGHDLMVASTGCAVGCRWANVAYLECLGICSGALAIAGLLGCTFQEAL